MLDQLPTMPRPNIAPLAAWLSAELPGSADFELRLTPLGGSDSRLTYRLAGLPEPLLLRRPPVGAPPEAQDGPAREYRLLQALARTPLPAPRPVAQCTDPAVLGSPFALFTEVCGTVYRRADQLARLTPADGLALGLAAMDAIAALHLIDPERAGLSDFARPDGFLTRELTRWRAQRLAVRCRDLPAAGLLAQRLAATAPPAQRCSVLHGDFRLERVVTAPGAVDRVTGLLDWETATLGDPLTDLGLFCVDWDGLGGLGDHGRPTPGLLPGWPGHAELAARYAERTGLAVDRLDWYRAFAYFRAAVLLEGTHYRQLHGLSIDEGSDRTPAAVGELVERGLAALAGLR